jgi:anti-sigma28 factor (negative regulator of flagellin synthesis)
MPFTGRSTSPKLSRGKAGAMVPASGEQIARAARVAELKKLVAAGRYHVEPRKLAAKILSRALQRGE